MYVCVSVLERYRKILEMKKEISSEELCYGLPKEFERFVTYAKGLEYIEEPDYEEMRRMRVVKIKR